MSLLAVSEFFRGENSSSRQTSKATKFLVERRVHHPASQPAALLWTGKGRPDFPEWEPVPVSMVA